MTIVENKYNLYINIPQNNGFLYAIIKLQNNPITYDLQIDTRQIDIHSLILSAFNSISKKWQCIDGGNIDSQIYSKICIEHPNINKSKVYFVEYNFYNTNNEPIFSEDVGFYFPQYFDLSQQLTIPYVIYTKFPTITWTNSFDEDGDIVKYQLFLSDNKEFQNCFVFTINKQRGIFTSFKIDQNCYDDNNNKLQLTSNKPYYWKVKAYDQYAIGEYDHIYSDVFCFILKDMIWFHVCVARNGGFQQNLYQNIFVNTNNQLLNQHSFVNRHYNDYIFHNIYVQTKNQTLKQKLNIKKIFNQNLYNNIYVTSNNQMINQNLIIKKMLSSNLYNNIYVTSNNQMINQNLIIKKMLSSNLYNNIYVTSNNQLLKQRIAILTYLNCDLYNNIYVTSNNQLLKFNIKLPYHFDLNNNIIVRANSLLQMILGVTWNKILNFATKIRGTSEQLSFESLVTKKETSSTSTTTKVKRYCDTMPLSIQTYIHEEKITDFNKWYENGYAITFKWNIEDEIINSNNCFVIENGSANTIDISNIYYKYSFTIDGQQMPSIKIYNNQVTVYPTLSGKWFFTLEAYDGITNQLIYINSKQDYQLTELQVIPQYNRNYVGVLLNSSSEAPQPPFFINGVELSEKLQVHDMMPTIAFKGCFDKDVDKLKYHIKISKDISFEYNVQIDTYVQHQQIVNYKLEKSLSDTGRYYLYIATCDYNSQGQKKSQVGAVILYFDVYGHAYDLKQKIKVCYQQGQQLLKFKNKIYHNTEKYSVGNYLLQNAIKVFKHYDLYDQAEGSIINFDLKTTQRYASGLLKQNLYLYSSPDPNTDIYIYKQEYNQDNADFDVILNIASKVNMNVSVLQGILNFDLFACKQYNKDLTTKCYISTDTYSQDKIYQQYHLPLIENRYLHQEINVLERYYSKQLLENTLYIMPYVQVQLQPKLNLNVITYGNNNYLYNQLVLRRIFNNDLNNQIYVGGQIWPTTGYLKFELLIKLNQQQQFESNPYPPPQVIATITNRQGKQIPFDKLQREYFIVSTFRLSEEYPTAITGYYYLIDGNSDTEITLNNIGHCNLSDGKNNINLREYNYTGVYYLHVVALSKYGISQTTSHYCIKYNNKPMSPTLPLLTNGKQSYINTPIIKKTQPISFYWGQAKDSDDMFVMKENIVYNIQISTDSSFNNIVKNIQGIIGNSYILSNNDLNQGCKYFWRVRALDNSQSSEWSLVSKFYVNRKPSPPSMITVKQTV